MIPTENAHLIVAGNTHPGMTGKNNEDQFAVSAFQISSNDSTPSLFTIVADGIGGHLAGEVASEVAVEMISSAVAESKGSQPTAILQAGIIQAGQTIKAQSDENVEQRGMGTTCIVAWIIDDQLYVASVGNSRMYMLRNRNMHQVNVDHTWVQEAVDIGALTPEQARTHPNANVIRRYLGSRKPLEVDLRLKLNPEDTNEQALANQGTRLRAGDRLLLCSDGLNDMVTDEVIQGVLATTPVEKIPDEMIRLANEAGGKDNITVIAVEVPGDFQPHHKGRNSAGIPRNILFPLVGVGVLAVLAIIAALIIGFGIITFGGDTATATPTQAATIEATKAPDDETDLPSSEIEAPGGEVTEPGVIVLPSNTPTPEGTADEDNEPTGTEIPEDPVNTITPWPTNTQSSEETLTSP